MTPFAGRLWPAGRDRRQLGVCRLGLGLGRLRRLALGRRVFLLVCAVHHTRRVRARCMPTAGTRRVS
eukprot:scaffold53748_cov67-Phaeocystis_antarctica.AAC.3